jgi:hypothetical protein
LSEQPAVNPARAKMNPNERASVERFMGRPPS